MKMSTGAFFLMFLMISASLVSVHSQRRIAFISIDCGAPSKLYEDPDTSITYSPDDNFIDTGISRNISSEYMYPNNPNLPLPASDLRSFPQGNKNCYTLKPEAGKGSLNLIRASFLYGNYDGKDQLPEFDLYLDVNLWSVVTFGNASDIVTKEIVGFAEYDVIHVCLLNKGLGTPFISSLELRPLNSSIYGTEFGTNASLVLFQRLDIGSGNGTGRYAEDVYDRVWSNYISPSWDSVITSSPITTADNGYRVPYEVIRTAARPRNGSEPLELYWNTTDSTAQFYVYMYFSEVEQLEKNQSRKLNISWNGAPLFGQFVPRYLHVDILSNSKALVGENHKISISKAENSALPPILNAVDIYQVMQLVESPTYSEDVDAIMNVKTTYQIKKTWAGDPCEPKNFSWEGLNCNYTMSIPRIISINLTSSNLSGTVAASIAKLSSLKSLDLSNNNLTGPMPAFLEELKSLKNLNLKGNQLSGFVPNALKERSDAGLLVLSVDSQNVCGSGSCKEKKKIVAPIVGSLLSALVVLIVLIFLWRLRTKKKSEGLETFKKEGIPIASKKCQFSYDEVVEITKSFSTEIGKGGFGAVYHGYLKDGTQVAVKMLSSSSTQGPREFQTEAELLMRIHHRNLASFIGYCDEPDNLALIYEYMSNGNLKDYLSVKSSGMTWELRLRIAIDAAQGLEYLHHGCKPPIVHRDVKTANILLSENLEAKISDFGLSKAFSNNNEIAVEETTVMGTAGYLDPEYYNSHKLNEKSDVYSFGVVLLELITGQPAVIRSEERIHIVEWVSQELQKGDVPSIVDRKMEGDVEVNSVWRALGIAMTCTTRTSQQRATMDFVQSELKQCLEMELSRNGEKYSGLTQESRETFSAACSSSSPYNSSMYTDSTNADSMTGPYAR